jgi:TPR repeat protein
MRDFEQVRQSRSRRLLPVIPAILAAFVALAVPLTAEAHGRKAVPSDSALFAQYQAGLTAYLSRDYGAALEAWRPLAERETESSAVQIFLGFMSARGLGLTQDPTAAAQWYGRAAKQDNVLAQIRLGLLYRRGEGVVQDPVQAYLWATLAARQESHLQQLAEALQETLAAKMTPAQIAEAERLADGWIETHRKAE